MVHVIVVNKDEVRDIVLAALQEKGYGVVSSATPDAAESDATASVPCHACCSSERVLAALERWYESGPKEGTFYRFALGAVEKPLIEKVLARTGGNQLAAARLLGINRNTLRAKIHRFRIRLPERVP